MTRGDGDGELNLREREKDEVRLEGKKQEQELDNTKRPPLGRKDRQTIAFLMWLYAIQGMPFGLLVSIPTILVTRGVSYANLGLLGFARWPFSLKLLWAPIVDSVYWTRFGRRKSWIVPLQFTIGAMLVSLATSVQYWFDHGDERQSIVCLALFFFVMVLAVATMDIAIDGWAISMLSREHVSWQSTCNSVGVSCGFFVANILFIFLESETIANNYIRPLFSLSAQEGGVVKLQTFMLIYGAAYILTSVTIAIFKKENNATMRSKGIDRKLGLFEAYMIIYRILRNKWVLLIALILLTVGIGEATERLESLKLTEFGVPREISTLFIIPLMPFSLTWPIVMSKYILPKYKGTKAIIVFRHTIPFKGLIGLVQCAFVYYSFTFKRADGSYPVHFYLMVLGLYAVEMIIDSTMNIAKFSFAAYVADPKIGGTYMTLMATLSNLGGTYPQTFIMFILNALTKKECQPQPQQQPQLHHTTGGEIISSPNNNTEIFFEEQPDNVCKSKSEKLLCAGVGGTCETTFDAYYLLVPVCTLIALVWLIVFYRPITKLSNTVKSDWIVKMKKLENDETSSTKMESESLKKSSAAGGGAA